MQFIKAVFKRMFSEPQMKVCPHISHPPQLSHPHTLTHPHWTPSLPPLPPFLLSQIYSLFLDTLTLFIEEHREYLEDWLFLMLLRLLHRHGSDLLAHMHYKLQLILELIR